MAQKIPEMIIPIKAQVLLSICLAVILVIMSLVYFVVLNSRTTWEGTCESSGWSDRSYPNLIVDCGSQGSADILSDRVLAAYLRNPGPLTCHKTAADNIYCEERPTLKESED